MKPVYDDDAWSVCHPEDLWIFDKLILARRLGYLSGPKGVDVPNPGYYIIRPCINVLGMGRGARLELIEKSTETLPDGFCWTQKFEGRHLSVDYHKGAQRLCVEGFRASDDLTRWAKWTKVADKVPYPAILDQLKGDYEWINVEYIGDKIVEIHLRRNPDFLGHGADHVIPVFEPQAIPAGYRFILDVDHGRLGFFIPR